MGISYKAKSYIFGILTAVFILLAIAVPLIIAFVVENKAVDKAKLKEEN